MLRQTLGGLMVALMTCGCADPAPAPAPGAQTPPPPPEAPPTGARRARTVYVPAYSHLPSGARLEKQSMLSVLLSVRNIDSRADVRLTHVEYYDTAGKRLRQYLPAPRVLRPLETAEFNVEVHDHAGGSGANFLVHWDGPADAHPLLTETVMVGHVTTGYVAFTSRGVELAQRPATPAPGAPP